VEVTLSVPAIEPTRTEISNVIESKQIESLPISGRLFTDFALLTPRGYYGPNQRRIDHH
jgi:hypothetical protein